ncbi:MAG: DUF2147 domain-containing protein [Rhodospirillaceae bacterium]|nr:DUF2147 domain-containing protein [Rhodospirillaceae bacterium]
MRRTWTLAAGLLALSSGAAMADPDIVGHWQTTWDQPVVVELAACDDAVCGRLVGLPDPAAVDVRNPDPGLAGRPLCRLQVLQVSELGGQWTGRFYNPEDGTDYSVSVHIDDQGRLEVWGSTGPILLARIIPLMMAWSPVPPPDEPCAAAPVS